MTGKHYLIAISAVASMHLSLLGADVTDQKGSVSGLIRAAYVSQENPDPVADTYTTAIGGWLKYETPEWNGLKAAVAGYASQKIGFATGDWDEGKTNLDMLGMNGDSFAYLGEAYVEYSVDALNLRVGRQLIETPMVNTDEIRMVGNSYEAGVATYNGFNKTTLMAGYIQRWAGYDSGDDISKFKKLAEGSHGAYMAGVTNESLANTQLQAWYYSIDKVTDILYADAAYKIELCHTTGLTLMAQAAKFSEDRDSTDTLSGVDGNVYGIGATLENGLFTYSLSYNQAFNDADKAVGLGLGGGPYYTSMEEITIDGMNDARAVRGSIDINLADAGIEGLSFTAAYAAFKGKSAPQDIKVDEWDMIAVYEYSPELSADLSYAMIRDKYDNADGGADGGYNRFLARLSYRF